MGENKSVLTGRDQVHKEFSPGACCLDTLKGCPFLELGPLLPSVLISAQGAKLFIPATGGSWEAVEATFEPRSQPNEHVSSTKPHCSQSNYCYNKNAFCSLISCFSLLLVCRDLALPVNKECGYDKWINLLDIVYWLLLRQVLFTCWGSWPLAAQSLPLLCLCSIKGRGNLSQYPVTVRNKNSSCFHVGLRLTS